jgi:hypothetical protein
MCAIFEPQEAVLFKPEITKEEWEKLLLEFIRGAPDSYWAPYAHLALAYVYEARALHAVRDPERKGGLASAKQHLDEALRREGFSASEEAQRMRDAIVAREESMKGRF